MSGACCLLPALTLGFFMRRFAIVLLAVSAGPAFAQEAATPPSAPAPAAPAPADQEKICVDQNPAASTRVHSQRVCRTLEEWNKRGGIPK